MNLYSLDIIRNDFYFNVATYSINRHTHEEMLSSVYVDKNIQKSCTVCFIKKAAIHTGIMEILDYNMPEKESAIVTFQKLKSALPLLGIACPFDKETFNLYCCEHTPKDIEASAEQIMPILQSCFEKHPSMSYLYPLFHMVMRSCYLQAEKSADTGLLQAAKLLSEEVDSLETLYTQARDYLTKIIIAPPKQGLQLPSSAIAEIYHSYCLYAGKQDFHSNALSAMEMKDTFLPDIHTQTNAHSNTQNWLEYLNHASNLITDNAIGKYPITSFKQYLCIGVRLLLEDELVIKKCKLCNGYFRVKYTSSQEYCTRIYRDTSTTCNEYASRKSYKEKLFSHPIHTEFTKSYNRLYARIRRGKLPADTPLMNQLKTLHDEYTENMRTHTRKTEKLYGKNI